MKFVVMLLNIININHLWTVRTFFNITSTIGKVAIDFGIRKLLFTILADLKIFHLFVNLYMKFFFLTVLYKRRIAINHINKKIIKIID